jgi:hypothetical protein
MMAIFTMCWTIWGAWNDLIFKGTQSSLMDCAKELALVSLRIKSSLWVNFDTWRQNLF